jgi:peptidoglycan/LPS O-acetylase OafA/YrhL
MKYRADIDGLRAVAVLPVVLYHFGIPGAAGGYLGVDVFFVISGYLICGMIAQDLESGRFSLTAFYKRRVMRIFPALFVMLFCASALAYVYFLPVELKQFSKSLLSSVFSVSNFYFASTTGYFDAAAETKPLMHSWSLGVEEQFYLFCPLFLLLAFKWFERHVIWMLALAAALSFVGEILVSFRNPQVAFFLPPFRAWELIAGALLALGFFPRLTTQRTRDAAGLAGLALLLPTLALAAPQLDHWLVALVACVGSLLVIASSETGPSIAGALLSRQPLVFVGLISYSLYLWHWPLVVFQRSDNFLIDDWSGFVGKSMLLALSLALAALSWRFIETPFRACARRLDSRHVFAGAATAMAGLALLAGFALTEQGAPYRFSDEINHLASYLDYDSSRPFREGRCFLSTNRQTLDHATCLAKSATKPNYLLVGDSHAAHLWFGLSKALPEANIMQASVSMCRPVLPSASLASGLDTRQCPKVMGYVFDNFLMREHVDKLLLSAAWKQEDLPRLAETLNVLKARDIDVVVMGPIVEYDRPLPRLLADVLRYGDPDRPKANRTAMIPTLDLTMRKLVEGQGATYVSVYDAVCPRGDCDTFAAPHVPLQFDAGHLTADGSVKVAKTLVGAALLH